MLEHTNKENNGQKKNKNQRYMRFDSISCDPQSEQNWKRV